MEVTQIRTNTPIRASLSLVALLWVGAGFVGGGDPAAHAEEPPRTPSAAAGSDTAASTVARVGAAQGVVDAWLRDKRIAGVTAGVAARCVGATRSAATHNADAPMFIASGAKLLTTATALGRLGPDHRFITRAHGELGASGIVAELFLVGSGDPQFLQDDIDALVDGLVASGLRGVRGDLVVDGTLFSPSTTPPGFDIKPGDAGWQPRVGAMGANYNAVKIVARPGKKVGDSLRVSIVPRTAYFKIRNKGTTGDLAADPHGPGDNVLVLNASQAADETTLLRVGGQLAVGSKRRAERRRVRSPDLFAGYWLKAALAKRGVQVEGRVRLAKSRVSDEALGPQLASVTSPPLATLIKDMNTWSNNAMAETLFKGLGRDGATQNLKQNLKLDLKRTGAAGTATWGKAQGAVSLFLVGLGVPRDAFRVVNGSGLFMATAISPGAMVTLLDHFGVASRHAPPAPEAIAFMESLAISGRPGTLRRRLRGRSVKGKVRAKTGTLDEVVSLSGYVPTRGDCLLALAVIINEGTEDRIPALRAAVDALVVRLSRLNLDGPGEED